MKRIVTVFAVAVLLLTMLLPVSASAATTVSLRNGIRFGDTMEQVIAKETLAISSRDSNKVETVAGTIYLGSKSIYNVSIIYHFDYAGRLVEIVWLFPMNGYAMDNYGIAYDYFKSLYGTPSKANRSTGGTGKNYSGAADLVNIYKMSGMYGSLVCYDAWIIGDTKIDIVAASLGYSSRSADYFVSVGFRDID